MTKSASALFYLIKSKHYITFQIPYDKLKDYFDIIKKSFIICVEETEYYDYF